MQNEHEFDPRPKSREIRVVPQGRVKLGEPCLLILQLGPAREEENIGLECVPSHWKITSRDIELVSVHPEVFVKSEDGGSGTEWMAEFDLLYPAQSASDQVPLQVIPRVQMCELDIEVMHLDEVRTVNLTFRIHQEQE